MRAILTTTLALMIAATPALAAGGGGEGIGLLGTIFIAFGVLIVLFQFIPAVILFTGMIKGLFAMTDKKPVEVTNRR